MLLIGDKIKQTKAIPGFNKVGKTFTIDSLDDRVIVFSNIAIGRGMMSMEEFEIYFEKVADTWSEWTRINFPLVYRVKGDLIELKSQLDNISVFCKPCEEDEFNLQTGLEICKLKYLLKIKQRELETQKLEIRDIEDKLSAY